MTDSRPNPRCLPLRSLRTFRRFVRAAELDVVLRWCLPAVVIGILLRGYLIFHFPAVFVHDDTASTLETATHLTSYGTFETSNKKTLLVPAIYCIPALLGIPVLPALAVLQHLLGLGLIFGTGLLVRAWFRHWQFFIIPVTLLLAIHPVLLWYEHVALTEIWAITAAVGVALASWLYYRHQRPIPFVTFLLSLLFMAISRPEGQLFALFGLALVIRIHWGEGKLLAARATITALWTVFLFAITQTSQSGTLLYASIVQFTPERLFFSPGVAESVRPVAHAATLAWQSPDVPRLVPIRKSLQAQLESHLVARGLTPEQANTRVNSTAKRAALETALRNAAIIPPFALRKFVIGHHELPALGFNPHAVTGQTEALYEADGTAQKGTRHARLAWGREFSHPADATAYFRATTRPLSSDWLDHFLANFVHVTTRPLLPIALPGSEIRSVDLPGLPWLYTLALLGMLALALREPRPFNFHVLFGLFLVGFFLVIMTTANVRARFRVLFEPFWILYAFTCFDALWCIATRTRSRIALNSARPVP